MMQENAIEEDRKFYPNDEMEFYENTIKKFPNRK
jgi:hypothetical protein